MLNKNTMEDPTFKKKFLDWDWLPKNKKKREIAKKARQAKAIQKREELEKEYDSIIEAGTPSTSTPNGRGRGRSRGFRGTRGSRGSRGNISKGSSMRGSHSGGSKTGVLQDDEDSSNGDDEESGDDEELETVSSQVHVESQVGDSSQETSNGSISNASGGSSSRKRSQPEANSVQKKQAKK